jgi:hypothetical protein
MTLNLFIPNLINNSGDCSARILFDMGEFALLAQAYSFVPLILLLLQLLLLIRAFFLRFLCSSLRLFTKGASLL